LIIRKITTVTNLKNIFRTVRRPTNTTNLLNERKHVDLEKDELIGGGSLHSRRRRRGTLGLQVAQLILSRSCKPPNPLDQRQQGAPESNSFGNECVGPPTKFTAADD
jgi:hypothetical protein